MSNRLRMTIGSAANVRNAIKLLLIVVYLAAGYDQYLDRLANLRHGGVSAIVAYVGMFGILSLSLAACAFIRDGLLRWFFACVFTAATIFGDSYVRITNDDLTYSDFISQIHSVAFAGDAVAQYLPSILAALGFALLLLLGIGLRPGMTRPSTRPTRRRLLAGMFAVAPLLGLMVLTATLFLRGGEGARGLPVMFAPLAYLNLLAYEVMTESIGPRESVSLSRTGGRIGHDIVLIIDESVSGNYLDINAPHGVPTALKQPPAGIALYNFGYAASIASCSADVNITLRFGGTRDDYVRINARMPSIWQYARAAGLQTVYLDAQRTGRRMQNLMTEEEVKDIDHWIQFDGVAVRDRDMAAADKLAALINDPVPQLIILNKMGAHFPVHDKFPDEFMRYRPALARGGYEDVGDTGKRHGFAGTPADWSLYRNSYRNTLLWNVGEFFHRLLARSKLDKAVIIYTSDHGQDLHERGNAGLNTHCGGDPVMEEGLVPLVVLQGKGLEPAHDWQSHLPRNRDRSSHYNIFPTLLHLMGFDSDQVIARYGKPLTAVTDDPFTFNIKFNARLGEKPRWKFIDLKQVVMPVPEQPGSGQHLAIRPGSGGPADRGQPVRRP